MMATAGLNTATIAVLAVVAAAVLAAIAVMVVRRKKGKPNGGCDCAQCDRKCPYRTPPTEDKD